MGGLFSFVIWLAFIAKYSLASGLPEGGGDPVGHTTLGELKRIVPETGDDAWHKIDYDGTFINGEIVFNVVSLRKSRQPLRGFWTLEGLVKMA